VENAGATVFQSTMAVCLAAAFCACGSSGEGAGGGDAGNEPWQHATPTWSSIYEIYFGPSGAAACSTGANCHAAADQSGVIASNFLCADKASCYQSLTGASNLVGTQDISNPSAARLLRDLRQSGGPGTMPLQSTFVFAPQDIDVIKTWIGQGAKND
jgi:hypothetical protein